MAQLSFGKIPIKLPPHPGSTKIEDTPLPASLRAPRGKTRLSQTLYRMKDKIMDALAGPEFAPNNRAIGLLTINSLLSGNLHDLATAQKTLVEVACDALKTDHCILFQQTADGSFASFGSPVITPDQITSATNLLEILGKAQAKLAIGIPNPALPNPQILVGHLPGKNPEEFSAYKSQANALFVDPEKTETILSGLGEESILLAPAAAETENAPLIGGISLWFPKESPLDTSNPQKIIYQMQILLTIADRLAFHIRRFNPPE